ncbi:MAG: pentapeptide repeat-containing protein, partial [Lachnospiraceae bacterium]|nr:pentapeptide repeat-containing protein [Lachnospiraceae bacterium]
GDCNTGDCNTGDCNTGDWNSTNFSSGCFNTEEQKIMLFNKPSDWTYRRWLESDARYLLNHIDKNVVEWVCDYEMTDEEKAAYPTYKTTGGYLKVLDESECAQLWWDGLSEYHRNIIKAIPNFDVVIFEQITGIKVGE